MWPLDVSSSTGCDFATNPSEVTSARSHSLLRLRGESAGVGAMKHLLKSRMTRALQTWNQTMKNNSWKRLCHPSKF